MRRETQILLLVSFIGIALILVYTSRYGIGITPDSITYREAAQNLLSGKGLLYHNANQIFARWPPLFPALLSLFELFGVEILFGARILHAIIFGLIIFAAGQFFRATIRSRALVILGTISVLCAAPLQQVSMSLWSEPIFILLVILFIASLQKFVHEGSMRNLLLIAAIAALACLQRYIGVVLVFTGLVTIIFITPKSTFLRKFQYTTIFGFIAAAPLTLWIVRNYILTATLFYHQRPSSEGVVKDICHILNVVSIWFVPREVFPLFRRIGAGVFLLAILIGVLYVLFNRAQRYSSIRAQTASAGVYVLSYCAFLLISAHRVVFERVNDRLLAPIYIFIIFFALIGLQKIADAIPWRWRNKKISHAIVILLLAIWLIAYPLPHSIRKISHHVNHGSIGYNVVEWQESPLVEWLRTHPLDGVVYSNNPNEIYFLTGKHVQMSPAKHAWRTPGFTGDVRPEIKRRVQAGQRTYLVWFKGRCNSRLYSIEDLRSVFMLEEIVTVSDGTVYLLQ
jgi:hypothetical protein